MLAGRRRLLASLAVLGLGVPSAACGPPRPPDVLLLVADTLRADRLGAYGGPPGLTPTLDDLAQRSRVYAQAHSTSSWTSPALASLFTSGFQSQHGVVAFTSRLGADEETLAEVLRRRGYATAGFNANALVSPELGYAQGFDVLQLPGHRSPSRGTSSPSASSPAGPS
jgi:arylsulfatase A-like enzyme